MLPIILIGAGIGAIGAGIAAIGAAIAKHDMREAEAADRQADAARREVKRDEERAREMLLGEQVDGLVKQYGLSTITGTRIADLVEKYVLAETRLVDRKDLIKQIEGLLSAGSSDTATKLREYDYDRRNLSARKQEILVLKSRFIE